VFEWKKKTSEFKKVKPFLNRSDLKQICFFFLLHLLKRNIPLNSSKDSHKSMEKNGKTINLTKLQIDNFFIKLPSVYPLWLILDHFWSVLIFLGLCHHPKLEFSLLSLKANHHASFACTQWWLLCENLQNQKH